MQFDTGVAKLDRAPICCDERGNVGQEDSFDSDAHFSKKLAKKKGSEFDKRTPARLFLSGGLGIPECTRGGCEVFLNTFNYSTESRFPPLLTIYGQLSALRQLVTKCIAISVFLLIGIAFVHWWSSDCSIYRRPDSIVDQVESQKLREDDEAEDGCSARSRGGCAWSKARGGAHLKKRSTSAG
jgi:hypothetical protein